MSSSDKKLKPFNMDSIGSPSSLQNMACRRLPAMMDRVMKDAISMILARLVREIFRGFVFDDAGRVLERLVLVDVILLSALGEEALWDRKW